MTVHQTYGLSNGICRAIRVLVLFAAFSIAASISVCAPQADNAIAAISSADTNSEKSSAIEDLNAPNLWEKGGIGGGGVEYKAANIARTKDYLAADIALVYAENDYVFRAAVYDSADNFVGFWDTKDIAATSKKLYYLNPQGLQDYKIRLMCQRLDSDSISVSDCSNIHFLNETDAKAFAPLPTLTFVDDDGSLDALRNWESICDETGIEITSALVTGVMGDGENNPQKASWDDVAQLQSKGFEFVSHTHNHINIVNRSEALCIQQFESSIAALREHGCSYQYLVYPYNAITSDKIALVKQYFEAGIGLGQSSGNDNTLPLYTYWIRRSSINEPEATKQVEYEGQTIDAHAFRDIDTLKDYIDDAIINNSWTIIMTHLRNDDKFYFDEEARDMIIELCNYAKDKGVEIKTFGAAYEQYKNISQSENDNKHIYGTTYYIKDCNGVAHYKADCENGAHPVEIIPGYAATCTTAGITDGQKCYLCGETVVAQAEIPTAGTHTYDDSLDAECNICGATRETSIDSEPFIAVSDNQITVTANGATDIKVHAFNITGQTIADVNSWNALKAADPTFRTYAKSVFTLKSGDYVLRLQYVNSVGETVIVSHSVTVGSAEPVIAVSDNQITVTANGATNIKVHAFNITGQTIADVNSWNALKAADPTFRTYTKSVFTLKSGDYVLRLQYVNSVGETVIVSHSVTVGSMQ